jgi:hypothetical protein
VILFLIIVAGANLQNYLYQTNIYQVVSYELCITRDPPSGQWVLLLIWYCRFFPHGRPFLPHIKDQQGSGKSADQYDPCTVATTESAEINGYVARCTEEGHNHRRGIVYKMGKNRNPDAARPVHQVSQQHSHQEAGEESVKLEMNKTEQQGRYDN